MTPTETVAIIGPGATSLAEGQYVGPCSIVTPPEPDPCEAAQHQIRYPFLGQLVNAKPFKSWVKGAPNDYARLTAYMQAPICSTATNPQPQPMTTFMGAAIGDAVEAIACARGVGPVVWPAPNPPPVPGSTDITPPGAPGPVTVTPGG